MEPLRAHKPHRGLHNSSPKCTYILRHQHVYRAIDQITLKAAQETGYRHRPPNLAVCAVRDTSSLCTVPLGEGLSLVSMVEVIRLLQNRVYHIWADIPRILPKDLQAQMKEISSEDTMNTSTSVARLFTTPTSRTSHDHASVQGVIHPRL